MRSASGRYQARQRYVKLAEKLAQEAARRVFVEEVLSDTPAAKSLRIACTLHFGAYGALCPSAEACGAAGECARVAARAGVLLKARLAVLSARAGAERLDMMRRAEVGQVGPPTPRTTIGGTP